MSAADNGAVRILVVEDSRPLARQLGVGLTDAGFAVDLAADGAAALEKAAQVRYDVVVLDRDLPVIHGDEVCRRLVGTGPRVLMLTAAGDVDDRVEGLLIGADDYLAKPFDFGELVARVRTLSRRAPSPSTVMRRGELQIDLARRTAQRGVRAVHLTKKEFGILEVLALADGAPVSAEQLIDRVWDENLDPFSNVVSVTIARLRRKLGEPDVVETVVGVGYRL